MGKHSKGRSQPKPDAATIKEVTYKLEEALVNENQFIFNYSDRKPWEVTMYDRDSAVHVMRFLKVWFDLTNNVFFSAVSYLDMFLAHMKVQEKFLPCLLISCINVAVTKHGYEINKSQLVTLSQSKCSVKDMERMSTIIIQKLNLQNLNNSTPLDLLKIYMDIFRYIAFQFKTEVLLNRMLQWQQLCTRLEVLVCDLSCACFSPSVLALAFIHFEMERFLCREIPEKSNYYSMEMFYMLAVMIELQSLCKINSSYYSSCFEAVTKLLKEYDSKKCSRHRQKLKWRFSLSTCALARRTSQNYYSVLDVVQE